MTEQERNEQIERWATFIIPAVFKGENELRSKHPEWKERLENITEENKRQVAADYCIAIAEEILNNSQ